MKLETEGGAGGHQIRGIYDSKGISDMQEPIFTFRDIGADFSARKVAVSGMVKELPVKEFEPCPISSETGTNPSPREPLIPFCLALQGAGVSRINIGFNLANLLFTMAVISTLALISVYALVNE